jgi:hypothetical protein
MKGCGDMARRKQGARTLRLIRGIEGAGLGGKHIGLCGSEREAQVSGVQAEQGLARLHFSAQINQAFGNTPTGTKRNFCFAPRAQGPGEGGAGLVREVADHCELDGPWNSLNCRRGCRGASLWQAGRKQEQGGENEEAAHGRAPLEATMIIES